MLKTLEVQLCLLDVSFDLPAAEEFGALFQHWPESLNCPFTESISKDLLQTQMLLPLQQIQRCWPHLHVLPSFTHPSIIQVHSY